MSEATAPEAARRRTLRMSVPALVLAAVALWAASRMSWVQARTVDDLRGVRISHLTGQTWAPEVVPLALAVLAAVAATFALRGVALRVLAVALLAVGAAAAVPAVRILTGGAVRQRAAELATPPTLAERVSTSVSPGGPLLALLGVLLTLVAAVLLVRSPRTARGLSGRYRTPAVRKEAAADAQKRGAQGPGATADLDDDVSERMLWDALDAGHDPTVQDPDPGPPHPPRDVDHPADRVSDTASGATHAEHTRGARGKQ